MKILVNDGMHEDGKQQLIDAGHSVSTDSIPQGDLFTRLPEYDAIIVRSATKVRQDLIDACPNLRVIARGGVGLDNIDVDYAKAKGIEVINTPAASSESVAELVFGHFLNLSRSLHSLNRAMPEKGAEEFKALKKGASKGSQMRGKTLGVIGLGRIGVEAARIGLALGMEVLPVDLIVDQVDMNFDINGTHVPVNLKTVSFDSMLAKADYITLHVPFSGGMPIVGAEEIGKMKDGVIIVNAARGGAIDEAALLEGLNSGKISGAGLDVFANEPTPSHDILSHPGISLSPHIGGSTLEAQRNIGLELAEKITAFFN